LDDSPHCNHNASSGNDPQIPDVHVLSAFSGSTS